MIDLKSAATGSIGASSVSFKLIGIWTATRDWLSANIADVAIAVLVGVGIYLLLGLAKRLGMRLRNRTDPLGLTPTIGRAGGPGDGG